MNGWLCWKSVSKLTYSVSFLPTTFLASLNMNQATCCKKTKPNPDNIKLLSTVEQTVI